MTRESGIHEVRARLSSARAVTVLTGAGISADSGVPTFRGADGLWRNFRAEDLATPEAFARDPRLVWEWYNWRREIIASKQPNAAHYAVAEIERRASSFWLITQNVDNLHRRAGSRNLAEIHGNSTLVRCIRCGTRLPMAEVTLDELPPRCLRCEGILKVDTVAFGEPIPADVLAYCQREVARCDCMIVAGTSATVTPAAWFPVQMRERCGFTTAGKVISRMGCSC